MFTHLLVPLDGSRLAEAALPFASRLAQALNASITLIHIIEADAPQEIHQDRHLTRPDEAEAYLKETAGRSFPPSLKVDWHVHTLEVKDVARSIVAHAGEISHDLVVMCTHGSGGMRDWFLGSIAQQVVAFGTTPVLLIPPGESGHADHRCGKALVAVDGVPDHEQGFEVAIGLAQACQVMLHLLMVIPTLSTLQAEKALTGRLLPGTMSAVLDLAQQGGRDYLGRQLERLRTLNIPATAEIARGDAVTAILDTAARINADLIVLGTHGKTGMDAFWAGSVAPKVSSKAPMPLLLVPVHNSVELH